MFLSACFAEPRAQTARDRGKYASQGQVKMPPVGWLDIAGSAVTGSRSNSMTSYVITRRRGPVEANRFRRLGTESTFNSYQMLCWLIDISMFTFRSQLIFNSTLFNVSIMNLWANWRPLFCTQLVWVALAKTVELPWQGTGPSHLQVALANGRPLILYTDVHCKDALLDCSAPGGERCESLTWVDEIWNTFLWMKSFYILINISLTFVPKGPIDNNQALV